MSGSEFRWILEGFTPDTMPMARLAEYMQQLAKLLGQETAVHFSRVEKGSLALISNVSGVPAGKVSARLEGLRRGEPIADVARAYQTINAMLAEDETAAVLRDRSAVIIRFPGARTVAARAISVPDAGSVVGYLYMMSEAKDGFHARVRLESGGTLMCTVSNDVAKKLRALLFETVKLYGTGIWSRSLTGDWTATTLDITDVVAADSVSLREVVSKLRALPIEWLDDDPLAYQDGLNDGGSVQ